MNEPFAPAHEGDIVTTNSELRQVKAIIRRRGTPAEPRIDQIIAEVRTPDNLGLQPPDPNLKLYNGFFLMIEWTFAVPYLELQDFHLFLKNNEQSIADSCALLSNGDAQYLGTWWIYGLGPSTYRTLWQYKNEQAIALLKAGLKTSANFGAAVKKLRLQWAKDPGRVEQQYQPAALFADLRQASKVGQQIDPLVDLVLTP